MIEPAELEWRDQQPFSTRFGDIYHAADGAAEVMQLFLAPLGLPAKLSTKNRWTLGELGFGSGLNFAVLAEMIRDLPQCRLHFISFERHPIRPDEFTVLALQRAAQWPIYRELAAIYPALMPGWQRRQLLEGRLTLSLCWGDAAEGLDDIVERQRQPVDAWLLDGFAPDRNPELWTPALLKRLGALSRPGTGVATFSAAGHVRRGLTAAGFSMERLDQRPRKRQSLVGHFVGTSTNPGKSPLSVPTEVRIAGAGLAGASVARHLADNGIPVTVYDPLGIAGGTSGIPLALQHTRLLSDNTPAARWRYHALQYTRAYCRNRPGVHPWPIYQEIGNSIDEARAEKLMAEFGNSGQWLNRVNSASVPDKSWLETDAPALFFPDGAIIEPPVLCQHLLDHRLIQLQRSALPVESSYGVENPLILATGQGIRDWPAADYLEIAAVGGQIDWVNVTRPLDFALAGNRYLIPDPTTENTTLVCGTTYEHHTWDEQDATQANLKQLRDQRYQWRRRWRGIRAVSSDRLPVIGALYNRNNQALAGLQVSTGHGSSGTMSTTLGAAMVCAELMGQFAPITREVEQAVSPLRFRLRQARRGFRHGIPDRYRDNGPKNDER